MTADESRRLQVGDALEMVTRHHGRLAGFTVIRTDDRGVVLKFPSKQFPKGAFWPHPTMGAFEKVEED